MSKPTHWGIHISTIDTYACVGWIVLRGSRSQLQAAVTFASREPSFPLTRPTYSPMVHSIKLLSDLITVFNWFPSIPKKILIWFSSSRKQLLSRSIESSSSYYYYYIISLAWRLDVFLPKPISETSTGNSFDGELYFVVHINIKSTEPWSLVD